MLNALGKPCDRLAEHRAKAFARFAINALTFRRSTAAFVGSEPKPENRPGAGLRIPRAGAASADVGLARYRPS